MRNDSRFNGEEVVYFDLEQDFRDEVLKGLQSIDMNLSLIVKALQKPIKPKKKSK